MGNMFRCTLKSGGASGTGIPLIVTCDANFAGLTITATDGTTTLTQTCPSSSPYTVQFDLPNTGSWTVSGTYSGQVFSTSVLVSDFEVELQAIPEGSTVTPVNDIQIWMNCANVFDKNYTTISQVLADTSLVTTLIASNNAADYMARSTSWASNVTANSSAMSKIGANDYCADKLLANSTWLNAICNSTYMESVLNVKVPTMTSNTTPSGEAIKNSENSSYQAYKAFDNNASSLWIASNSTNAWVGYDFGIDVSIKYVFVEHQLNNERIRKYKIQGSSDENSWADESAVITANVGTTTVNGKDYDIISVSNKKRYHRLLCTERGDTTFDVGVVSLQFYGRA